MDWAGTAVDYGCFAPVAAFIEAFAEKGLIIDCLLYTSDAADE